MPPDYLPAARALTSARGQGQGKVRLSQQPASRLQVNSLALTAMAPPHNA